MAEEWVTNGNVYRDQADSSERTGLGGKCGRLEAYCFEGSCTI